MEIMRNIELEQDSENWIIKNLSIFKIKIHIKEIIVWIKNQILIIEISNNNIY